MQAKQCSEINCIADLPCFLTPSYFPLHLISSDASSGMAKAMAGSAEERGWLRLWMIAVVATSVVSTGAAGWYPYGLDTAMSEAARRDPLATNDSFASLPSSIKKALARPSQATMGERMSYLNSMQIMIPINVKLVGFSVEDRWQLQNQIAKYMAALNQDNNNINVIGDEHHGLMLGTKLALDVAAADAGLADKLFAAIRQQMELSSPVMRSHLHSVPHTAVDHIIQQDLDHPLNAYTVYLLNLRRQEKPYAYSYTLQDPSPAFTKCLGTLWTGRERYLWVDLSAGPVDYGPALSGEGLLPRGEFHPLAALHREGKPFLADLASLIWSAAGALFVPALRIPVHFETDLLVQLVHIHAYEGAEIDRRGLDWSVVEQTFLVEAKQGLLLAHQSLRFKRHAISYTKCPICVSAVTRSLRSYTSRFLFENYTLIVNEYLDSQNLHHLLAQSEEALAEIAGIDRYHTARVLPVYVFDLDYDKLILLDRYHQAIAFKNMVIAVRTRSSQTVSDYNCNGRHVITQVRELERPIVGALLQSMWGVSPTHLTWSPRHNSTLVDYTWSVGQTPFGPFSESLSLSFVQRDAAPRNVLLTGLNLTLLSAMEVLESIRGHGGEMKLLGQKRHIEFTQRWNVLRYKLDKAVSAISHFDFDTGLYFIKSSEYDLYAVHNLVYQAATELEASLVCFKDPPFPWGSALTLGGVFLALFYILIRRDRLFTSKRKQF